MKKHILMTGVTGVLGQDLIKKMIHSTGHEFYLIVRGSRKHSAVERVEKILREKKIDPIHHTRVHILSGDVTLPFLGLSTETLSDLQNKITDFYHIAALTALNGSEEDCMAINFQGTHHALDIAWRFKREGVLKRFIYFSTAYAVGSLKKYHSLESGLPKEPAFANFYESSKYKAETLVRATMAEGLPTTIIRPSIVVGHSQTGEVSDFNVIYPFFKMFAHGALSKLVARPEHTFNIVPIDFVVDATCVIAEKDEAIGRAFHLVSKNPPSIGMILKLKDEVYPALPEIQVIDPDDFDKSDLEGDEKFVYEMLEPYMGYSNDHLSFDTKETDEILKGTGVVFPLTDYAFLRRLIDYAVSVGYLVVD